VSEIKMIAVLCPGCGTTQSVPESWRRFYETPSEHTPKCIGCGCMFARTILDYPMPPIVHQ
jgi:hypothetical protein